jgi:thiamine pyrophosphokinase
VESLLLIAASIGEPHSDFFRQLIEETDVHVAVDGGLSAFAAWGHVPDHLVGDLDSADPEQVRWAEEGGAETHRLAAQKDETDLEVAIDLAQGMTSGPLLATGVLGGRVDHELVALGAFFAGAPNRWTIREPHAWAWPLTAPVALSLEGRGATVSIVAWSGSARVSTSGMRYPLDREVLGPFAPRGVSNVVTGDTARIVVHEGSPLVVNPTLDFPPVMEYAQQITNP